MKSLLRDNRGVAAIEFAFGGLAMILTMLVILDLGDLALVLSAMTYSTQVAARGAALGTTANLAGLGTGTACLSQSQIVTLFNNAMPSILPAAIAGGTGTGAPALQTSWVQGSGTGTSLQITAHYNWVPPGMPPGMRGVVVPLSVSETQMVTGTSGTVAAQCS